LPKQSNPEVQLYKADVTVAVADTVEELETVEVLEEVEELVDEDVFVLIEHDEAPIPEP